MTMRRTRKYRYLKWLSLAFCVLVFGNGLLLLTVDGYPVRKFGDSSEFGNAGDAFIFLWTRSGGGSIAWDTLPGLIPELEISEQQIYIVVPFWIPFVPLATMTIVLFWRDARRDAADEGAHGELEQPEGGE